MKIKKYNHLKVRQAYWYSRHGCSVCDTPRYAVEPVLEFIKGYKNKVIWCPFDTDDSMYVRVLKENGYTVVNTHILNGQDFYEYEPKKYDIIISNPPFKNKRAIFERAIQLNKPFMLLMSMVWLNDSTPKILFGDNMELLMFDKRIIFRAPDGTIQNKITFSCGYYCKGVLPRAIQVRKLNVKDNDYI